MAVNWVLYFRIFGECFKARKKDTDKMKGFPREKSLQSSVDYWLISVIKSILLLATQWFLKCFKIDEKILTH